MQTKIYVFLLTIVVSLNSYLAIAQPGLLDATFGGGDGKIVFDLLNDYDEGKDIVIQDDGKILIAGTTSVTFNYQFALIRLNTDGSLDNSFSDDGIVTVQFGSSNYSNVSSMALQSDGKIILAGTSLDGGLNKLALARFNTDGSLDNSFSDDGLFVDENPVSFYCQDIALDANENIIVAGGANFFNAGSQITVMRLLNNGTVDYDFGSAGVQSAQIGAQSTALAVTIQSDGKIVAAGATYGEFYSDVAIARFTSTGELDTSFDGDGKRTFSMAEYDDYFTSVLQLPNGKLLLGGVSNIEFALVQLNSNGANNTAFSSDGIVLADMNDSFDEIHDIALDSDGNIIVAGHSAYNIYDVAVLRFLPNGMLDPLFSLDGKTTIDFSGFYDYGYGLAIQTDGKIIVVGTAANALNNDIAVARLQGVCPLATFQQNITITEGESFTVGNNTYTEAGVYQDVITTPSGCDSTVTTILNVTVAINEITNRSEILSTWPNPFHQELTVMGTNAGEQIKLYDISGKCVLDINAQQDKTSCDTRQLPAGTYILRLTSPDTSHSMRIFKE